MSVKNIIDQRTLSDGRSLVTFEVGDSEYRHYAYSARAGKAIAKGVDPAKRNYKCEEIVVPKAKK